MLLSPKTCSWGPPLHKQMLLGPLLPCLGHLDWEFLPLLETLATYFLFIIFYYFNFILASFKPAVLQNEQHQLK